MTKTNIHVKTIGVWDPPQRKTRTHKVHRGDKYFKWYFLRDVHKGSLQNPNPVNMGHCPNLVGGWLTVDFTVPTVYEIL